MTDLTITDIKERIRRLESWHYGRSGRVETPDEFSGLPEAAESGNLTLTDENGNEYTIVTEEGGGGGGPTEVASGSETVPDATLVDVELDLARDKDLAVTAYPDSEFTGRMYETGQYRSQTLYATYSIFYDDGSNGWVVDFANDSGQEAVFNWTVYEL